MYQLKNNFIFNCWWKVKTKTEQTCRFSRFIVGNEKLRDFCLLSFANFTSLVSSSWTIVTSFGSFLAQPRINSEYFGCNFDGRSGFRICKPIARRRFLSCMRHSSLHSSVLLFVVFIGPSTSLNSIWPPFCICCMLDANWDDEILRNSLEKSWQVRVCFRKPHWQSTSTVSLHGVSGHSVSRWQGALQLCGHIILGFVQFCLQTSVSDSQTPGWHVLMHLCWPHFSALLHGKPHENSGWLHGMIFRCSCFPWQYCVVNAIHGGQVCAEWQLWVTGWSHGCDREHGFVQAETKKARIKTWFMLKENSWQLTWSLRSTRNWWINYVCAALTVEFVERASVAWYASAFVTSTFTLVFTARQRVRTL